MAEQPKSSSVVLACDGVRKSFRSGKRSIEVLVDVGFELREGESLSIRGESGSGKTTLLNILSALETPDSGSVHWSGRNVTSIPKRRLPALRARSIGLVFQSFYLIPEINALQNVTLAGRIAGLGRADALARAHALLEKVELSDRLKSLPDQLSGGERQRVAVARALINRPLAVLADEPTGNLDERTSGRVMDLLLDVCREEKAGLILVTHNPGFAARTDRGLLLHNGVLSKDAGPVAG